VRVLPNYWSAAPDLFGVGVGVGAVETGVVGRKVVENEDVPENLSVDGVMDDLENRSGMVGKNAGSSGVQVDAEDAEGARSGQYTTRDTLHLLPVQPVLCPEGYCVSERELGGCASGRTGVLCSGCILNTTPTLMSTKCVPVGECGRSGDVMATVVRCCVCYATLNCALFSVSASITQSLLSVLCFTRLD
jgi:hypothetical protein